MDRINMLINPAYMGSSDLVDLRTTDDVLAIDDYEPLQVSHDSNI